ncbi:protein NRT1/ PTR FAMILY 5.10-like [Primulina huaijiensis]|uniref:protein NRT1/ PTR FAMILY 5.10-like n=1 Tax=Primulina huaijiensis TaxID=1492673 RepID=UPI003CC77616
MDIFTENDALDAETPLLDDVVQAAVNYHGFPAIRSKSGGWRSASFIISVEIAERFAYYGITSNLINFLTGQLGQSIVTSAENVNAWSGAASLLPLLGAFVADSYLGRYRTIVFASLLYILGLGILTLAAVWPFSNSVDCHSDPTIGACTSRLQVIVFFFALYLVAAAQGGHKPCVQAFGADQFDVHDPKELKERSSFFNWWYFGMCGGNLTTLLALNYIQDNLGWGLGFGIPCIVMSLSLIIFLVGTMTYRFSSRYNEGNPFIRIGRVFVNALRNRKMNVPAVSMQEKPSGIIPRPSSQQFKFLNKALLSPDDEKQGEKFCSINEVEDAKAVLRLIPIWSSCLVFGIVFSEPFTFFTKQGVTMDRSTSLGFEIPSASLQSFISLSVVIFIPLYDRVLVPLARTVTMKPTGITMLQRIGFGILFSIICMAVAALIEAKRLEIAREFGLVDTPEATVPMSVAWLIPQYLLFGIAEVFTMVGLQEFFYDQVPREFKSIGLSLYLSIFGVGSLLSSLMVSIIEKASGGASRESWFSNNMNRAHLDYFYWLLAGLSVAAFMVYLYFAKSYVYSRRNFA